MTGIRGLEPFGFQGSSAPSNNDGDDDDDDDAHQNNSNRRVHPPTEENTTEDDDAEQELQEEEGDGKLLLSSNKQQSVAEVNGTPQQQQQLAEKASRALSRLQIQSTAVANADPSQSNAIIFPGTNREISLNDDNNDTIAAAAAAAGDNDETDATNNNYNQLVCTNNDTTAVHNQQDESYGALTVLPPNELSTTTSDAALAANTFTEMISDGVRHAQQRSSGVGSGLGVGGESCPPGFFVDGSGVVRRSGGVGGGATGANLGVGDGGVGIGMPYPDTASIGGGGGMNDEQHGMMMNNNSPGGDGQMGGGGGHHYNEMGGGGGVATSTASSSIGIRPPGGQDPLEGDAYHDEDDDDDEEEEEDDSSEISASDEDGSWIAWFCGLRGNEFFCEVDEDYIQDDFNLTGLNGLVPYYDYALDMVLDVEMPMEDSLTEEQQEIVESAAEMLYGLIHARYIVTNRGMHAMYEKYRSASFGRCPHVFCQGQPVLPVGLSDLPRNYTVNVFCPRCHGLFFPKSTRQANIDGAYFGTTFPHLYLMNHPVSVCFCCELASFCAFFLICSMFTGYDPC